MATIFSPEYLEANRKRIKELEARFRDSQPVAEKRKRKRIIKNKKKSRR